MGPEVFKNDEVVEVEMKCQNNLLPELFPNAPNTVTYKGKVCGHADYDEKDSIRILGDQQMPVRVIAFRNILKVNGKKFTYTPSVKPTKVAKSKGPEEVKIKGSKGNEYILKIFEDGRKICSCPGYGFRGHCKHVDEYNERMAKK